MPTDLHLHAEQLREQEKFDEALKEYAEVIKDYYSTKNYSGVVDALGGQSLTYKHLYLVDPRPQYLDLCFGSAKASLEIALQHNLKEIIFRCYFNLGEVNMLARDFVSAVKNFQKSYDLLPEDSVEKSRSLSHLAEAKYFSGDRANVTEDLLKSLDLLHQHKNQVDDYTYKVWETGILMKLAFVTKIKKYLNLAENIIKTDNRLLIRGRQLFELKQQLKSST